MVIYIYILTCTFLILLAMHCTRETYAGNWDFMDLPDMCGKKRRLTTEDVPHFGGEPNASEVWNI